MMNDFDYEFKYRNGFPLRGNVGCCRLVPISNCDPEEELDAIAKRQEFIEKYVTKKH